MIKFVLPAFAIIAAPALAAAPSNDISFERDGIHFVAQQRTVGQTRLISGREVETGKTFNLRVVNGRIRGVYDAAVVDTSAPRASTAN